MNSEDRGTLIVNPALLEVRLEKVGEEKEITIQYKNTSNQNLELEIFPIDFKQSSDFGEIEFFKNDPSQYSYSLSSFISFDTTELVIAPNSTATLSAQIKNRDDISPGGHYAAIVARPKVSIEESGSQFTPSLSTLLFLHKTGGERFNLSLKSVSWPGNFVTFGYKTQVELLFQNEGNIQLVPYGTIEVKDSFNRLLYKGSINTGSVRVLPESRRYIANDVVRVEKSFPISVNTIIVQGSDSLRQTQYLNKNYFLYFEPWFCVMVLGVLIAGVLFWKKRFKKLSL